MQCCKPACRSHWHVQCIAPEAVPGDDYNFRSGRWVCEWCRVWTKGSSPFAPLTLADLPRGSRDAELIQALLRVWVGDDDISGGSMVCKVQFGANSSIGSGAVSSGNAGEEITTVGGHVKWVTQEVLRAVPADVMMRYFLSSTHVRLVQGTVGSSRDMASPNIYPVDTPLDLNSSGGFVNESRCTRNITKRVWRFRSNDQYFGVTQYLDAFTEGEVIEAEKCIDVTVHEEKEARRLAMQRAAHAAVNVTLPPHLDMKMNEKRIKLYYGYRYEYNNPKSEETLAEARIPKLFADVPPIPEWLRGFGRRAVEVGAIPSLDFIDIGVVNMYADTGAKLSVHVDPSSLFKRPIVSARFFGDGVLSFGAKGQYEGQRLHSVPLLRGALTVMQGYAADHVTHAVVVTDVKGKGCSVMMRGCQPAAIAAAEDKKAQM